MKKEKFCQSCAMPLMNKEYDMRGTELDGSRSEEYCSYCYLNGEFTNPNITYDEVLNLGIKGIESNQSMNKFTKFIIKKSYPSLLKSVKRWNNSK